MSRLAHLERAVDRLTPLSLAEKSWDNVGIIVEAPERQGRTHEPKKRRIFLCNDLTPSVCEDALGHDDTFAIVTYHPPIFSGLRSLTLGNPLQASLLQCISRGVSVFTIHTASDNSVGGVNDFMGSGLLKAAGVETDSDGMIRPGTGNGLKAITEAKNVPDGQEGAGGGRIVDFLEGGGRKLSRSEVVQAVKDRLNLKHLQAAWAATGRNDIQTVAICAGSGAGVLKGVRADLYLTGEMSHHDILAAVASGTHVLCCNHSATERPWLHYYGPRLERALNEIAKEDEDAPFEGYEVVVSQVDFEPLQVV